MQVFVSNKISYFFVVVRVSSVDEGDGTVQVCYTLEVDENTQREFTITLRTQDVTGRVKVVHCKIPVNASLLLLMQQSAVLTTPASTWT